MGDKVSRRTSKIIINLDAEVVVQFLVNERTGNQEIRWVPKVGTGKLSDLGVNGKSKRITREERQ